MIEVSGIGKSFRIPERRIDSFKERAVHPFTRVEYRQLQALKDISFEVRKGEFFGIVGRNGSGKSSLLKILAGIYRQDRGRVRMAGRVAPFIELGVGFNPELTARENGVLNGVLMGLTLREARRSLDAVLDFAELRDFAEVKLKNYSTGMLVRLAFAVTVQSDPDIMLIDEVLAVGDAAFAEKCMDVFHEKRRAGRTVVLVTHDMSTVQTLCHRAMLLHDGELLYAGRPEDTALRYYRINFSGPLGEEGKPAPDRPAAVDLNARVLHARILDPAGKPTDAIEQSVPIVLDVAIEAAVELDAPSFVCHVLNAEGTVVSAFTRTLEARVPAGGLIRLSGEIENRLVPGSYFLDCWIRRDREHGDMALQAQRLLRFTIYGTAPRHGLVSLEVDVEAVVEPTPKA